MTLVVLRLFTDLYTTGSVGKRRHSPCFRFCLEAVEDTGKAPPPLPVPSATRPNTKVPPRPSTDFPHKSHQGTPMAVTPTRSHQRAQLQSWSAATWRPQCLAQGHKGEAGAWPRHGHPVEEQAPPTSLSPTPTLSVFCSFILIVRGTPYNHDICHENKNMM